MAIMEQHGNTSYIGVACPMCQEERVIEVPTTGYLAWQRGALIQNAFPGLSPDDREGLITGYCGACWDRMFGFG